MSRYLVTGAGGFIGSYIARRLIDRGDEVVIFDNLTTGQTRNLPPEAHMITGDISQCDDIERIPGGHYDAVLHLAGQSSGEISHDDPSLDLNTNALGTLLLLQWSHRNDVSQFLYASSMAIYGLTDKLPVRENQTLDPYSFYGISKQAAEQYVRHYTKQGLNTTVFRMFNVYGPTQNLANMKQGMVSIYLSYLMEGPYVLVKGSLDRFRDFIYIDDVVDAWLAALDNSKSHGQVYNLGSGRKTLVRELLPELICALGHDLSNCTIEKGEGTPGDQFGIYADITAIKTSLDWQPKISLKEGIGRVAAWAKDLESPVTHQGEN